MQPLDFEAQQEYILILMVENLNPLSNKAPNLPVSTATVVVTVANENEAPHFRENPIQIVVPESVAPGTLLKSNIAFDPDNSDLRYDAATEHEDIFVFLRKQTYWTVCVTEAFPLPPPPPPVAGTRSAEILRGGWTSTEIQETLLPREPLT